MFDSGSPVARTSTSFAGSGRGPNWTSGQQRCPCRSCPLFRVAKMFAANMSEPTAREWMSEPPERSAWERACPRNPHVTLHKGRLGAWARRRCPARAPASQEAPRKLGDPAAWPGQSGAGRPRVQPSKEKRPGGYALNAFKAGLPVPHDRVVLYRGTNTLSTATSGACRSGRNALTNRRLGLANWRKPLGYRPTSLLLP